MPKYICPILIKSEDPDPKYDFGNGCVLRKITDAELLELFKGKFEFHEQRPIRCQTTEVGNIWSMMDFGLVGQEFRDGAIPYHVIDGEDAFEIGKVLASLRIHKPGGIYCPLAKADAQFHYFYPISFPTAVNYRILASDMDAIIRLIASIGSASKKKSAVILHRFRSFCDEDLDQGLRLVEAVGLIESIICGDIKEELRFRSSYFGVCVLHKHGINTTVKEMQGIYDLRSKIVHSGRRDGLTSDVFERAGIIARKLVQLYFVEDLDDEKIKVLVHRALGDTSV